MLITNWLFPAVLGISIATSVGASPGNVQITVTGDDGTKKFLLKNLSSKCLVSDSRPESDAHRRGFEEVIRAYSKRDQLSSGKVLITAQRPDGQYVARAIRDEDNERPHRVEILRANDQSQIAELKSNDDILDVAWEPNSGSLLMLQRRFRRHSYSPMAILSALAGHPVSIYEFRIVEANPNLSFKSSDSLVVEGKYSLGILGVAPSATICQ